MTIKQRRDRRHRQILAKQKAAEDYYWANQPYWDEDRGNRYEGYNSTDVLPYNGN